MKSIIKILCGTIIVSAIVCFGSFEAFSTIHKGDFYTESGRIEREGQHVKTERANGVFIISCKREKEGCCWEIRNGELEIHDQNFVQSAPTSVDIIMPRF